MKFRNMMIQRGYWDEAGEGKGGSSGDPKPGDKDDDDKGQDDSGDKGGKGEDEGKGKDDKPKPSEKEAKLLKEVMQKKEKLQETQSENQSLREQLKQFEGIDVDRVKEMLKSEKDAEERKLEEKGQWDQLKAQMIEMHQTELDAVKTELETLKAEIGQKSGLIDELTVGHKFDASKFIAEDTNLTPSKARIIYGSHFETDGDGVVAYDKPAGSSDRTPLVDSVGEPLSFEAAIAKIIDTDPDRDHLMRSKMKPGADSKTTTGKVPDAKPEVFGQDRIARALSAGKK